MIHIVTKRCPRRIFVITPFARLNLQGWRLLTLNHTIHSFYMSDKTEHPPLPQAFADLGVRQSILRGLADASFVTPSEIQSLLIPRAGGRGYSWPGAHRHRENRRVYHSHPAAGNARAGHAGADHGSYARIGRAGGSRNPDARPSTRRSAACRSMAGRKSPPSSNSSRHHPEILVGTPGRVIDLLDRRLISLENIRFVVLDEVDRMLDIGFRDDIRNILSRIKGVAAPPSATRRSPGKLPPSSRKMNRLRRRHAGIKRFSCRQRFPMKLNGWHGNTCASRLKN